MKHIAFSDLRRISAAQVRQECPMIVTFETEPLFVIGLPDQMAILGDLHPRIQHQLKALVAKARMGMPPAEKITEKDVKDADSAGDSS